MTIGSAATSDIWIDDPSVAPTHLRLHVAAGVEIEDLGSDHGTRLVDGLLSPGAHVPLPPHGVIQLGSVILALQPPPAETRLRSIWSAEQFVARIDEECARAARLHSRLVLVRLRFGKSEPVAALEEALAQSVRAFDVIAALAAREYAVLLVEADQNAAQSVVRRLCARLGAEAVLRAGVACFGRDGRSGEDLLARALVAQETAPSPTASRMEGTPMLELDRLLAQIAPSLITVLILGETGVGKEVLAERLHACSLRAGKPFLKLNCAALAESLLESELFGHERGAFTGAVEAKPGLLETAEGGTVFLDEIGELPMASQTRLLRVIEERRVLRVGAVKARAIDVRFVAATNRELEVEVERSRFRRDLFFRLNGATLAIPPLRERVAEIPRLAVAFIHEVCVRLGRTSEPRLGDEALADLEHHRWPGNIRELRNVIERAVLLCPGSVIEPEHLPLAQLRRMAVPVAAADEVDHFHAVPDAGPGDSRGLRATFAALERERIVEALARCAGNQTQAATLLGVSRRYLCKRISQFDLPRPRRKLAGNGGREDGAT